MPLSAATDRCVSASYRLLQGSPDVRAPDAINVRDGLETNEPSNNRLTEAPQVGGGYPCRYSAEMTRSGATEGVTTWVLISDGVHGAPRVSIHTGLNIDKL